MQDWVRQFRKGLLELCVLNFLFHQESYGYEIVRRLQEFEVLSMSESTLYPILARLRKDGHLAVRVVPSDGGPQRRYFSLTQLGRGHLESLNLYWENLKKAIDELREHFVEGSTHHV